MEKTQLTTKKPVHLDITIRTGVWIEPEKFIKQIADAGYAARQDDIRLTVTGKISKDGDRLLLTLDDVNPGPITLMLVSASSKDKAETETFNRAFKEVSAQIGRSVEITGRWTAADKKNKTSQATLFVMRLDSKKE